MHKWMIALATVAVLVSSTAGAARPSAQVQTFAYYSHGKLAGKLAGWVRRDGKRQWWASNRRQAAVYRDLRGSYKLITNGSKSPDAYAWPAKRGNLDRYIVQGPLGDPNGWIIERLSPTRWNIYYPVFHPYLKRLEGFTRGPDGPAAALAFAIMDEDLLPK